MSYFLSHNVQANLKIGTYIGGSKVNSRYIFHLSLLLFFIRVSLTCLLRKGLVSIKIFVMSKVKRKLHNLVKENNVDDEYLICVRSPSFLHLWWHYYCHYTDAP